MASVGSGSIALRVWSVDRVETAGPRFVLAQALAKGGRDEQAIETATELGVDTVIAWRSDRCIVRWSGKEAKALAKWAGVLRAAGKQSRRPVLPVLEGPFTTVALARRLESAATVLLLHEEAQQRLVAQELPTGGEVVVVVGPEGGISPAELELLVAAGATPVRLGREVLRSASAGPAALAILASRTRW